MAVQRALLVIADIGGYTKFMKVHRINLSHAQDVVARLLEAVIDGAAPRLRLSKLEGDAALFWAPLGDDADLTTLARQVGAIRRAFVQERTRIDVSRACTCDGCMQVANLKLKFVATSGEIALQKVKSFTELAGMDVILVHRMLKNSVPVSEYVLMTDPVRNALPTDVAQHAVAQQEEFEGVGPTQVHYIDLDAIERAPPPLLVLTPLEKLVGWVRMTWRALPYMLGFKEPCGDFRNMQDALGVAALPAATKAGPR
jgi:hypothetical protein